MHIVMVTAIGLVLLGAFALGGYLAQQDHRRCERRVLFHLVLAGGRDRERHFRHDARRHSGDQRDRRVHSDLRHSGRGRVVSAAPLARFFLPIDGRRLACTHAAPRIGCDRRRRGVMLDRVPVGFVDLARFLYAIGVAITVLAIGRAIFLLPPEAIPFGGVRRPGQQQDHHRGHTSRMQPPSDRSVYRDAQGRQSG